MKSTDLRHDRLLKGEKKVKLKSVVKKDNDIEKEVFLHKF